MKKIVANNTNTQPSAVSKGGFPFIFRFINKQPLNTETKVNDHIFTFFNSKGFKYYVNCTEYSIGVYAVKFYLKIHKTRPDKFRVVSNLGEPMAVLKTVVTIMLEVLKKDPNASFAFIGMPKNEEDFCKTKRYNVYSILCKKYFNPETFDDIFNEDNSFYAILNKKQNTDRLLRELEKLAKSELKDENPGLPEVSLSRSTSGKSRRR